MSETPHRYTPELAGQIETAWQDRWEEEGTFRAPNPAGSLAEPEAVANFAGGHPLGYIATDVYGHYQRMLGKNVLHALGYDAFGLPAEQYAVQTGQHPRKTTEDNIVTMRRQLRRLGLAHDERRSVATTDTDFYRWTQWIFVQIFNAWFDPDADSGRGLARHIDDLIAEFDSGARVLSDGRDWSGLSAADRAAVIDGYRLAYVSDAPVNWCPGLGTVLANEEVTAEGRSDIGNYPVFRRNMRQWKMRITAYADRLLDDLERLDWPEKVKVMQRNWIGRSQGALIAFPIVGSGTSIEVFTTRPDTLFGATFMVLAPEHPPHALPLLHTRRRRRARATSSGRRSSRTRPGFSPVATRPTRPMASGSRSSSPTTSSWDTALGRSWRCPDRISATGTSPRPLRCRSCARCSPRRGMTSRWHSRVLALPSTRRTPRSP